MDLKLLIKNHKMFLRIAIFQHVLKHVYSRNRMQEDMQGIEENNKDTKRQN